MIKPMYVVRDTMAGYKEPSLFPNDEVAERDFAISFKEHPLKDYYQLWKVGTYDTESGTVIGIEPELRMKGVDIICKKN